MPPFPLCYRMLLDLLKWFLDRKTFLCTYCSTATDKKSVSQWNHPLKYNSLWWLYTAVYVLVLIGMLAEKHLGFFHSHEFWSTSTLLSVVNAEVISGLYAKGWRGFLYTLLHTSTLQVREAISALHSFGLHAITLRAKPILSGIFSCFKWCK